MATSDNAGPFDAVLLISFGGPGGLDDVRPYLQNVLRGRRIAPQRVEEVARHYELFGGVSPITELTMRQAKGLGERLHRDGPALPVYVGMRNWHPLLPDTMAKMADAGVRRAIGFITAAHQSYSSCEQYKENVRDARVELARRGKPDIAVTYVDGWHAHPKFIAANVGHIRAALAKLDAGKRDAARLIFTAHSIPAEMAEASRYREQLHESARVIAAELNREDWALTYQSRSGRPQDPWLEPDVCDYLRAEHGAGLRAAVIAPIGFLCDHVEVLYDLDHEAADVCRRIRLPMVRAESVNDDPLFMDMMAEVVRNTYDRHLNGCPLPIAGPAGAMPDRRSRGAESG